MNHHRRQGRQRRLFDPEPPIRLKPALRQAVLPALAALIAQVLRPPARIPRRGGRHEKA